MIQRILFLLLATALLLSCQDEEFTPVAPDSGVNYLRHSQSLGSMERLVLPQTNIRRNTHLRAAVRCPQFSSIRVGRGEKKYEGYYLDITSSEIVTCRYIEKPVEVSRDTFDMPIRDSLVIDIDYHDGATATLKLRSGANTHSQQISWWGGGAPFVQNSGKKTIDVTLTLQANDAAQPVWFFADSYFDWRTNWRWPYFMDQAGVKSWLADHRPEERSAEALTCFLTDTIFGTPQYAVWCMGMNDASDTDQPNSTWLSCVEKFIQLCQSRGITPILCTIPSVPHRDHSQKTQWVRQSGLRYIDVAQAVGSDDNPNWTTGMLAPDGVHPTPQGAQAIANQVMATLSDILTP